MKNFRLIIICISIVLILVTLFAIDYKNFISRSNLGAFLGITAMIINILAMILSNIHEAKNERLKRP
jgi:hypothetical protein